LLFSLISIRDDLIDLSHTLKGDDTTDEEEKLLLDIDKDDPLRPMFLQASKEAHIEMGSNNWENEWVCCPNVISNHNKNQKHRDDKDHYELDEIIDSDTYDSGNEDSGSDFDTLDDDNRKVKKRDSFFFKSR
jgi:hypothetical protein